jgi:hypothetical protein
MLVASVVVSMTFGMARAQEIPLVTGEQWAKSTAEMKKAYLIGMANIVQVEMAYAATPASEGQSVLPRMVRGL